MTEHEEHEWIPPREDETILGFDAPQDKVSGPKATKSVSMDAERFATLATGLILYSLLGLTIILVGAVGFRVFKWAFGL